METSVVVFDIRNFTDNYLFFSSIKDNQFKKFIEDICSYGYNLALKISDGENNFYFNTTGDGFILLFFSDYHFIKCYLWGLLFNYYAIKKCNEFENITDRSMSFGIGIESGDVEQISIKNNPNPIYTYLGNVINIASRIESLTKTIARTTLIIGDEINQLLVKTLYNIDYRSKREDARKSSDEKNTNKINNLLNETNQKMLVNYISLITLKGVDKPIAIYRLSPHFFKKDNEVFLRLINSLSSIIDKNFYIK